VTGPVLPTASKKPATPALPRRGPYHGPVQRKARQDPRRLARRQGGPVRPRLAERLVCVGRGEQAGGRIQLGAADPGRVPGPVHALVVAARDQAQRGEHRRPGQDPAGVVRVQAHLFPLLGPQRPRPLPHPGRHRDPALNLEPRTATFVAGVARKVNAS
jgi:hypothetical protein